MRKNVIYLFVAAASLLAISCQKKEADTYQPAEPVSGAQYYFPSSVEKSYKLSEDLTQIEIAINRVDKEAASTAIIEVTDTSKTVFAEGKSTISAAFAAGEKESKVSLPIDFSKYSYGDLYGIDLAITEETTPYGVASLHIEINLPEPWVQIGKGTWVDDVVCGLYGLDPITVPCLVWENQAKPGLYRVEGFQRPLVAAILKVEESSLPEGENWRNCKIEIDATNPDDVRIPLQDYGVMLNPSDGFIDGITSLYKGNPFSVGTLKDGIISFPTAKGLLCTLNGEGYYYANQHGKLTIGLPGAVIADYSAKIEYNGLYSQKDGSVAAIANVTLGADVDEAVIAIAPGEDPNNAFALIEAGDESLISVKASGEVKIALPEEIAEAYSIVIAPIAEGELIADEATYDVFAYKDFSISVSATDPAVNDDGVSATVDASFVFGADVEYAKVKLFDKKAAEIAEEDLAVFDAEGGDYVLVKHSDDVISFTLPAEGDYTIVAISYGLENAWNAGIAEVEFVLVSPWEALGYIEYTDNVLTPWWGGDPVKYYVPIEKNNTQDGLFRLVDVYTKYHPWNEGTEYDPAKTYYAVIDATDPDHVVIPIATTGCDWGYGIMSFGSLGAYYLSAGYSIDVIVNAVGDIFGKYKDGVISFPAAAMYMVDDDAKPTSGNQTDGWSMDLNTIVSEIPAGIPAKPSKLSASRNAAPAIVKIGKGKDAVSIDRGRLSSYSTNGFQIDSSYRF